MAWLPEFGYDFFVHVGIRTPATASQHHDSRFAGTHAVAVKLLA